MKENSKYKIEKCKAIWNIGNSLSFYLDEGRMCEGKTIERERENGDRTGRKKERGRGEAEEEIQIQVTVRL